MNLTQAKKASPYNEATIVLNGMRYSVDEDNVITGGVDGMPVSIITHLPESVQQSEQWEPVAEAES